VVRDRGRALTLFREEPVVEDGERVPFTLSYSPEEAGLAAVTAFCAFVAPRRRGLSE